MGQSVAEWYGLTGFVTVSGGFVTPNGGINDTESLSAAEPRSEFKRDIASQIASSNILQIGRTIAGKIPRLQTCIHVNSP